MFVADGLILDLLTTNLNTHFPESAGHILS